MPALCLFFWKLQQEGARWQGGVKRWWGWGLRGRGVEGCVEGVEEAALSLETCPRSQTACQSDLDHHHQPWAEDVLGITWTIVGLLRLGSDKDLAGTNMAALVEYFLAWLMMKKIPEIWHFSFPVATKKIIFVYKSSGENFCIDHEKRGEARHLLFAEKVLSEINWRRSLGSN